jgi:hypothetical protein
MSARTAGVLSVAVLALSIAGAGSAANELSIKVVGNRLIDRDGHAVRLLGVNRSSFEYACAQGWGMSEGPTDSTAIAAMTSWHINVVRVPLNEACWLGLPSVNAQYRGAPYRQAVTAFVRRLHAAGLYVIVDLHWNAPGARRALGQQRSADADHSPAFWRSVATAFRNDRAVLFDLYNEPHDISWECWRDGCRIPNGSKTAGMKQLVNAVRSAGATQPILLGGLNWANDLSGWLHWRPPDPRRQLVASVHVYDGNACGDESCWDSVIAEVAGQVPVVSGEIGEEDCAHGFIDKYMSWADAHGVSYLAWGWNVWECRFPGLITDYDGTPTEFGVGFRDHLAMLK